MIQSRPQQEFVAVENLERQGYYTYLPKISARKRKKNKVINQIEPMFPRYLFIHLSSKTDNWGPIRSTIGVSGLVRFGFNAAKIPDFLVEQLMDRENAEGIQPEPNKEFAKGEKVRIVEGPFEGYEAIFESKQANDRVLVLLSVAEKHANVKLSEFALEKLN